MKRCAAGMCCLYSLLQPDATAASAHQWQATLASAVLARKGLDSKSLLSLLAFPMQIPCRIAYVGLLKLNMCVSHPKIRLCDSRNDPLAPKIHLVLRQLRGMLHSQSHRLILEELQGRRATVADISPWSMVCPILGHNLSLIPLGKAETHERNIRETDECVHTVKCNSLGSIRCKSCCTKWSSPAFPQWLSDRKELSENKCSYQITGIDFLS